MPFEDLSDQRSLVESTLASLKLQTDTQACRDMSQCLEQTRTQRQALQDKTQESLQQLSRRLQGARNRVDASKAQREEKSHAEVMRDLFQEQQAAVDQVSLQEQRQQELEHEIAALEKQLEDVDENVEAQAMPDEQVLKLQILRGLGVEPLANAQTGLVEKARVWTADSASVVSVRGLSEPAHQLAAKLWDLC
ncbi:putative kinetochore protein spc24 [Coemansia sp. RSA 1199]|nr:putative kinetochore protein spc24 [Coemansia sp. RSA 1199]